MSDRSEREGASDADARARLVVLLARRVFGDGLRATNWLADPNELFGGRTPLVIAIESVAGYGLVRQALDQVARERLRAESAH